MVRAVILESAQNPRLEFGLQGSGSVSGGRGGSLSFGEPQSMWPEDAPPSHTPRPGTLLKLQLGRSLL